MWCHVGSSKVPAVLILESRCFLFFRNAMERFVFLDQEQPTNAVRYLWVHLHLACFGLMRFCSQISKLLKLSFDEQGSSYLKVAS